jgi:hypothetical protein
MNFANKRFKNLKLQLKKKTKKKFNIIIYFLLQPTKKNQFNMMFTDFRVFVEVVEREGKREQI